MRRNGTRPVAPDPKKPPPPSPRASEPTQEPAPAPVDAEAVVLALVELDGGDDRLTAVQRGGGSWQVECAGTLDEATLGVLARQVWTRHIGEPQAA